MHFNVDVCGAWFWVSMSKVAGPHPKSVFCMQEATLFIFLKILFNYLHVTVPWLNHIAVQTSDFPVQWKLVKVSVRWTAGCWLTRVVPTPQRLLAYLLVNTYIIKCQINFKESIYILESGEQDWRAAEKTRTHWGNIITSHHHTQRSGKVFSYLRFRVYRPLAIFDLKSQASQPVNKGLSVR